MTKNNIGPQCYENWRLYSANCALRNSFEYPIFSDTHITGEITEGLGPYKIINTIAIPPNYGDVPSLVIRIDDYSNYDINSIKINETDMSRYHGGNLVDEIAALISLCFGLRLMAGGINRRFDNDDPKGRPISYEGSKNPYIFKRKDQKISNKRRN